MPEGPSLVILKEAIAQFVGKKIIKATGNAKIDMHLLENKKILAMRTWGKQFFIVVKDVNVRIHLLMFGTYSINEMTRPASRLRLGLEFAKGSVYFYTCSVKFVEGNLDELYDWKADVMSDLWSVANARKKLKALPKKTIVSDALLDQQIFSGVGNIIKSEVLYRIHLHPETKVSRIPPAKLTQLINESRNYSFDFLEWKKAYVLRKHWLAYAKKVCRRCDLPLIKTYTGVTKRRTFYCENCQIKY